MPDIELPWRCDRLYKILACFEIPFAVLLVGCGLSFKHLFFKLLDVVPRVPQLFLLGSQSFLNLSKVPREPLLI